MDTNSTNTAPASTTNDNAIALLLNANRVEILRLAGQHGARNVRLFGSAARGEATAASDLDILVDFESGRSLLDRIALIQDLEDLLGIDVDVVTERAVHRELQADIVRNAQPL